MPQKEIVLFLDSGIGGLPYLDWVRSKLKKENYVYFADKAGFPYGQKTQEELFQRLRKLIKKIMQKNTIRCLILACNTASVLCLEPLRAQFSFPIVGTVPALKPAASFSKSGAIGLLATEGTVDSPYLKKMIEDFAKDHKVHLVGTNTLVEAVENRWTITDPVSIEKIIIPLVENFKKAGVDQVVLGCTHFLHIQEPLKQLLGEKIQLVDSCEGVGKQVLRILERIPRLSEDFSSLLLLTHPGDEEKVDEYQAHCTDYGLKGPYILS